MKKIIIRIITIVIAFFMGLLVTGFFFNKGNLDMTAPMAEAGLPVLYFENDGAYVNPSFGYTSQVDASCLRSGIAPIDEERTLHIALKRYNAKIQSLSYEIRSIDMERLVQDGRVEDLEDSGQYVKGSMKVKDLLEDSQEYLLIFHAEVDGYEDVQYFARISNGSYELVKECTAFAKDFHNATLDPENTYPITQYLETDTLGKENSFARVDIHSKYKTVIWDGMPVKETKEPTITYLTLEDDVVSLRLDYQVTYETELYQVRDYFRVRRANMRMYLLDYERTAERVFSKDPQVFEKTSLNLGIQWKEIPHMSNEEGSVINFVVSNELWSYDIAQNKLSRVFSFQNGKDERGLHDEFEIRLINMEDSGSMDFIVTGYMNRGRHEGETGTAVMRYDSLTNTTEELLFIQSTKCFGTLSKTVGELLYISHDDKMYLSYAGDIYTIDLNVKNAEVLTENLSAGDYLISRAGDMLAWHQGGDRYSSTQIMTMDMKTGVRHTYTAEEGEYLRALAFSGDDFIYGVCKETDVIEDFAGNTLFPMNCVKIVDHKGEAIRDFDYSAKNKYVISASSKNNRIDLQCIEKNEDGTYSEALAEAITSNEEEREDAIVLTEQKDKVKRLEKVFKFETEAEGKRKDITPRQVLFEDYRTISLEEAENTESFHSYGKGEVTGVYTELRKAIVQAYDDMGVVTNHKGQVVWERGKRKNQSILELAGGREPVEGADSLEASLRILLEQEGVYADVRDLLDKNNSPYEILKENSQKQPENLTGCDLSMILYYISRGEPVLAMTAADSAEIIAGYDAQNIYVLDALSGQVTKVGKKDAAAGYEASGNVFFGFLE